MKLEFKMTDLGMMRCFLGLEIQQEKSGIFVSQGAYAKKILQKFRMSDYNPVATPMELGAKLSKLEGGEVVDSNTYPSMIGSLRYLTFIRLDIAFVVGGRKSIHGGPEIPSLESSKDDSQICQGGQRTSGCSTKRLIFLNLQVMWIMTGVVTLMIARALRDMHSTWEA
jgi:Reverse transcriptase (RNA-dependent DNA polymerase)